ncbi:thymidine phosphorylase [bacterium]|nr:thymidine phosphorylase [bacterium]
MRIVDLIEKKKKGLKHTREEIEFIIDSLMNGTAADYQISAWLMAVYFNGMDIEETTHLTRAMINSGEVLDLSMISNNIIDKHSTGGVGDKITIILIPILQALGVPIVKLSGRGLGFTGGTIDKLESIPNFNCALPMEEILKQVKEIGAAIASQTAKLAPADGKLYALRDVTATVDSMPLIASSVVSKKIASGANNIILDVKYGSGAFMKTAEEAKQLSELMVQVGKNLGKKITAVVSAMNEPLGRAVGNSVEIIETIEFLKGNTSKDLEEITYKLASLSVLKMDMANSEDEAVQMIKKVVEDGSALEKFRVLIEKQGGNSNIIDDYTLLPNAAQIGTINATESGYVESIDALCIAKASKILGAGRDKKTDDIDYSVGVYLNKKTGDFVQIGDTLATLYVNADNNLSTAEILVKNAFEVKSEQPEYKSLIYAVIE